MLFSIHEHHNLNKQGRELNLVCFPLHHKLNCTPPKIRTWTLRILSPLPLPVGLVGHSYRERDSNSQSTGSKPAAFAISPSLQIVEALGLEPKTPVLKARVR